MPLVQANISYTEFIAGRDVNEAVGFVDKPGAAGEVSLLAINEDDVLINQAQYDAFKAEVLAYNAMIPVPALPEPTGDRLVLRDALQDSTTDPVIKAIIRTIRQSQP